MRESLVLCLWSGALKIVAGHAQDRCEACLMKCSLRKGVVSVDEPYHGGQRDDEVRDKRRT